MSSSRILTVKGRREIAGDAFDVALFGLLLLMAGALAFLGFQYAPRFSLGVVSVFLFIVAELMWVYTEWEVKP